MRTFKNTLILPTLLECQDSNKMHESDQIGIIQAIEIALLELGKSTKIITKFNTACKLIF